MGEFQLAFERAVLDEGKGTREALELAWHRVSLALPRRTDLGALFYTEPTLEERMSGRGVACQGMDALLEHYAKPLAFDLGRGRF